MIHIDHVAIKKKAIPNNNVSQKQSSVLLLSMIKADFHNPWTLFANIYNFLAKMILQ